MPPYAENNQTIHPGTSNENNGNKLSILLRNEFPHIPIITLPRKYFNDEKGKQHIVDLCIQEDIAGLLFGASTKYVHIPDILNASFALKIIYCRYFCLAALASVFQYVLIYTKSMQYCC